MKKTVLLLVINYLLLIFNCSAQSPWGFNYQGVVRDASNLPTANSLVALRFSILVYPANTVVYQEEHTDSTNAFGLFSIVIGEGNPSTGANSFAGIDWTTTPYWIQSEVDVTGGNNYTMLGSTPLKYVPYAKFADKAKQASLSDSATFATTAHTVDGINLTGASPNTILAYNAATNDYAPQSIAAASGNHGLTVKLNGVDIMDSTINHRLLSGPKATNSWYCTSTGYVYSLAPMTNSDSLKLSYLTKYYPTNNCTGQAYTQINMKGVVMNDYGLIAYTNKQGIPTSFIIGSQISFGGPGCLVGSGSTVSNLLLPILPNDPQVTGFNFNTTTFQVEYMPY